MKYVVIFIVLMLTVQQNMVNLRNNQQIITQKHKQTNTSANTTGKKGISNSTINNTSNLNNNTTSNKNNTLNATKSLINKTSGGTPDWSSQVDPNKQLSSKAASNMTKNDTSKSQANMLNDMKSIDSLQTNNTSTAFANSTKDSRQKQILYELKPMKNATSNNTKTSSNKTENNEIQNTKNELNFTNLYDKLHSQQKQMIYGVKHTDRPKTNESIIYHSGRAIYQSICAPGSQTNSLTNTTCTQCLPGTFNMNKGSITIDDCINCPAGTFAVNHGSYKCTKCEPGTFNKFKGSQKKDDCISCPAGQFNTIYGSTECKKVTVI